MGITAVCEREPLLPVLRRIRRSAPRHRVLLHKSEGVHETGSNSIVRISGYPSRAGTPPCRTEPVRTVPFFNQYDDIQITQLGSTGLATTLGAAGIAQVPAFSRACRGRRPRRGTQHDPGAPRRHRRGGPRVAGRDPRYRAPPPIRGGEPGGEGLVAPTTRSSRRHTPGQVTPNDTSGRHSGRFSPFFAPGTVPCNPSELCQITCPIRPPPSRTTAHFGRVAWHSPGQPQYLGELHPKCDFGM